MRGQGQGGDVTSLEDGSKRAGILRVPVVEQIPAILKEAPSVHGYVPCHLLHPAVSRMDGDPSDVYLAAFDVDEEQNIEGHPSTKVKTSTLKKSVPARTAKCARMNAAHVVVCFRSGAGRIP